MNKEEYFDYNGVRYYAGTKFKMKEPKYKAREVDAVFQGYFYGDKQQIEVFYYDWNSRGNISKHMIPINRNDIDTVIIEIIDGNYYDELEAKKRYRKDSEIPIVQAGWVVYIFIMCLLIIFKDAWIGWIAATLYFFNWRSKKIKEEYYYD